MDVQFYGANCLVFSNKDIRIVVDDNLVEIGSKSVSKDGDILLFTNRQHPNPTVEARMVIDTPGEYELGNVSIRGIALRSHMDEGGSNTTAYRLSVGETTYLVLGHVHPDITDDQLEVIGLVDVLFVPVGGNGFTLDPLGASKVIRNIEPKIVIPTHYEDKALNYEVPQQPLKSALSEMSVEPKETTAKLRLKPGEIGDLQQLWVLEKD